ncbi:MAG TPA: TAT-variant-translocated molybdopterin oxidoreductase, partial [Tepidisphaeraceae bacterium]
MNDKTANDQGNGRKYWQSLTQLAETPGMAASTAHAFDGGEFTGYDPEKLVNSSRRKFLKLAGASMALAGVTLTGCRRWPKENLVPQNSRPIGRIEGVPEKYATVWELGGVAYPLLITTYDGRPIKVDGNPMHPACATFGGKLGSSTPVAQASLLEMYDPERARTVVRRSKGGAVRQPVAQEEFKKFVAEHFAKYNGRGDKLAVLIEETRSPTVDATLSAFKAKYPQAKIYEYEAVSRDSELTAGKLAFGQPVRQLLDLKKAKIIVSFDADLFGHHPNALRHTNDWVQNRKSVDTTKTMNRMYVLESTYSVTGSNADERFPVSVREIEQMVLQLGYKAGFGNGQAGLSPAQLTYVDTIWTDLQANPGACVIAGGYTLRPEVLHVIAALNEKVGSFGSTITLIPQADRPTHVEAMRALVESINTGGVETIVVLGGNPVYDAPFDLGFATALGKVPMKVALSLYENETTVACDWHVNRAHYLESWGDATMYDGSIGVQQPTIEPLFGGKTVAEILSLLAGEDLSSQDLLYRTWGKRLNEAFVATSQSFQKILHDGFVPGTPEPVTVSAVRPASFGFEAAPAQGTFELRFEPDYKLYDGRFANNGWLQECPHPVSKITWDNVAQISYSDAKALGVTPRDHTNDVLQIEVNGQTLSIPACVVPGQPKGVVTLALGYARKVAGAVVLSDRHGSIGQGIGYDTYKLRTSRSMWTLPGAKVTNTYETVDVASLQGAHFIEPLGYEVRTTRVGEKGEGGLIVHESTLAAFVKNPQAPHQHAHKLLPLQLFPEPYKTEQKRPGGPTAFNEPHAWGMTIDMNACIGCQACVV